MPAPPPPIISVLLISQCIQRTAVGILGNSYLPGGAAGGEGRTGEQ